MVTSTQGVLPQEHYVVVAPALDELVVIKISCHDNPMAILTDNG